MKKALIALSILMSVSTHAAVQTELPEAGLEAEKPQALTDPASQLSYTAQDVNASVEDRVDALNQLAEFPGQNALVAISRGMRAPEPEIRVAAIAATAPYPFEYRWRLVSPALSDEAGAVRNAAAVNLAKEFSKLEPNQQSILIAPLEEVKKTLKNPEFSEEMLLLANIHRWIGEWEQAQHYYAKLVEAPESASVEVWLNYADNFRAQLNEKEALKTLELGLGYFPQNANLHYSKALTLVRLEKKKDAAISMNAAATLAESNSYFWYLNGVLQEPIDIELSVSSFERAYLISGGPEQLYALCDIYIKTGSSKADACLGELATVAPKNVIDELKSKVRS